jgi:alkyldihydroxyacetonephosphate synthase
VSAGPPPPLRWWGWGDREVAVPPGLVGLLRDELGADMAGAANAPCRLEDVQVFEPALPPLLRSNLVAAVGGFHVRDDLEERVRHAAGRSYLDLLQLRSGIMTAAPDAVVHPATSAEVLATLRLCSDAGCAVVPFGGGTSVVGGVAPLRRDAETALVALDVDRIDALRDVDTVSRTATLGAGMRGPYIEASLGARGMTLGHFPQSFEYATAGGFAATRSAGQASSGYGRFDELVSGLRLQSPAGELTVDALPPHAAGPSLLQTVIGSEGILGVISEVTVRVRPRPAMLHYAAWSLPDYASGVQLMRDLAQAPLTPDVTRLADPTETRVSLAMAQGRLAALGRRYLTVRGHRRPCVAIFGWEGDGDSVGARVRGASRFFRSAGAVALGAAPAKAWMRDRFHGPYLRDALLDRRLLVETLETSTLWSRLETVRDTVLAALHATLSEAGTPPLIGSHVSHVYADGASLYFTVLARQVEGSEREQWIEAKRTATDAILAAGGAISHHHGVGTDHTPWLRAAVSDRGLSALAALKRDFDPAAVMNPGKLLD